MPAESEGQNRADSFHSCVPTLGTAHLCDIRVSIDQSRTPAPTSGRKKPASHGFLQRSPDARQPAPVSCRNKQRATPASRGVAPRRLDARQPTSGLLASTSERATIRITRCHAARREGCQVPLPLENVQGTRAAPPAGPHSARVHAATSKHTANRITRSPQP